MERCLDSDIGIQISSATIDPANSPSLSQLISTLVPALAFAGLYMAFFLVFRSRIPHAYAPRTYLGSLHPQERSEPLPNGIFKWIVAFFKISDNVVLNRQSLDGFLLLRYLKVSVALCGFGVLITWPILMPVNATGGGGQSQLNSISFGNIANSKNRYYAHVLVAWVFFSLVFYLVMRESIYYINLRQAYLISPLYANRVSSRTVLFTSVPEAYRKEDVIRRVLGKQVKNIWIASDCGELEKLVEERDQVAMKLEAAETRLVRIANSTRMKAARKHSSAEATMPSSGKKADESGSLAVRWVQPNQRPTHRLKGLIGRKVDTIDWCRAELERIIPKVEAMQQGFQNGKGKALCSVFAEFYTQTEAQAAYQSLIHHQPLQMASRFIGVNPEEVIWENLKISGASRVVRNIVITGVVTALLLFWAIPVSFVGTLSNISALTKGDPTANPPVKPLLPWLKFINDIPQLLLGVIQGFLPSVLLALLMMLLPPFLRWMAKLSGQPTYASVELYVQNVYFLFQVIQVFLVTTISSGAAASVAAITNNPTSATGLLAQDLPQASNFYVSYFVLQGLAVASAALANVFGVLYNMVFSRLVDTTPRRIYKRYMELDGLGWGTEFPVYTLLTVIGRVTRGPKHVLLLTLSAITYSIIAPIVLGFATVGLYLIYLAYRYNIHFVFNTKVDTKGLVYARALQQTTTGCYLGIICLIGLFAVKAAAGPLILMIIFLIFVILWHLSLNAAIGPLLSFLPKSIQVEEESLLSMECGHDTVELMRNNKEAQCDEFTIANDAATASSKATGLVRQPMYLRRFTFPRKPTLLTRFLFPNKHCDWHYFRKMVPQTFIDVHYDSVVERNAYYHPAIKSETPVLWIPRDPMGVSAQECQNMGSIIRMTDEGAGFDGKGRVVWNHTDGMPPIHKERIHY